VSVFAYILIALGAYLLGSIPTGYLVARTRGVDIRTVGSKNMGATNVFRVLGKGPGIFVLLADAFKGWGAIALARYVIHSQSAVPGGLHEAGAPIVAGLFAILGHIFTCWLKFKGGKGIATSAGVMVALVPVALLISLVMWLVAFVATRYVSVASIVASTVLPVATWFTTRDLMLTVVTALVAALAIYKHKTNLQRLRNGTENRFSFKKKDIAA
jgi:acyl phosphate:glycerol-3-phosphate acyltransferase